MDQQLSMNQIIHAAVRRDVRRTADALRALPAGDSARAQAISTGWAHLRAELTRHHEGEDTHLWPWLRSEGIDPTLLDAMESEHQDLSAALASSSEAISAVVADPSTESSREAAATVDRAAEVIDTHLEHEEREVEPLIRERLDTPGWKAVEKKFREGGIKQAGNFFAWIQDGAGDRELAALRSTVPAPVVLMLTKLFGRDYTRDIAPIWRG